MFTDLREQGVRVRAGWLWCSMVIDPSLDQPHVGYAIGRRVGGAVERNRIRRRLRALLAQYGSDLPPGRYLIGVSPRQPLPSWQELASAVERLMVATRAKARVAQ